MAGRDSFPLNEFVAAVREDITAWCVAAIVSSALLLLVYSALPDVRRTPGWQFLFSSICEIYVAVGFLVLSLDEAQVDPASGLPDVERMLCADYRVLVISVLAFDAAANNWRLLRYFNWAVAEFSVVITDLPEVIGIGIALQPLRPRRSPAKRAKYALRWPMGQW